MPKLTSFDIKADALFIDAEDMPVVAAFDRETGDFQFMLHVETPGESGLIPGFLQGECLRKFAIAKDGTFTLTYVNDQSEEVRLALGDVVPATCSAAQDWVRAANERIEHSRKPLLRSLGAALQSSLVLFVCIGLPLILFMLPRAIRVAVLFVMFVLSCALLRVSPHRETTHIYLMQVLGSCMLGSACFLDVWTVFVGPLWHEFFEFVDRWLMTLYNKIQ